MRGFLFMMLCVVLPICAVISTVLLNVGDWTGYHPSPDAVHFKVVGDMLSITYSLLTLKIQAAIIGLIVFGFIVGKAPER